MVELCADSSRQAGETLAGTAPTQDAYFLLEYREVWQPKAAKPGNNNLSGAVSDYIQNAIQASPLAVKPLFIRQQGRTTGNLTAFIAIPNPEAPQLYRLNLPTYNMLLEMPLEQWFSNNPIGLTPHTDPLFTVCAHKERDRACGQYGWGVYQALRNTAGDFVWQSTHIGGHRFAGTLIAFPSGTFYGHLEPEDVPAIFAAESNGKMYIEKARGRTTYPPMVQAAEIALRTHTRDTAHTALLPEITKTENGWQIQLTLGTNRHLVNVTERPNAYHVIKSSGDSDLVAMSTYETEIIA